VPVRPHLRALERGQDRLEEKEFFVAQGLDVHPFRFASTRAEFEAAVRTIGLPCVAKTRRMGYDGKGQAVLRAASDLDAAWTSLGGHPVLVEQFSPFDAEASIIGVRSEKGDIRTYPLTRNVHRAGILRLSEAPSPAASTELGTLAQRHVAAVMNALDYVGVLAIEFFIAGDRLLANEMAPRVHNSGHWTIEGARTSQFENHVRAVAGLPLGDCSLRDGSCVMVNIIGARPDAAALLAVPGLHLHDYAKAAKPGRKIGHATLSPVPEGWDRIPAVQAILA
jgi:5-(carboxyamino)imidazole ribonucleotide synthase